MKTLITLSLSLLYSIPTFACGTPTQDSYDGDRNVAEIVQEYSLSCNYNGISSRGSISIARERCPNGNWFVKLAAFDDQLTVKEIMETAPSQFIFVTTQAPGDIHCRLGR
jgi:hypothetical protein